MNSGGDKQSDARVVVVSNRLPYTLRRAPGGWKVEKSADGLATAMGPILRKTEGVWVGWSGDQSGMTGAGRTGLLAQWAERERYVAVDLPPGVARGFYEGFSNQTLWPLFHNFPYLFRFDPADWDAYREANRLFCGAVLEQLRPGDMVWVHDYQLMLLPCLLLLDYDGTLVGYAKRPQDAKPPAELIRLLARLAQTPATTAAIVSGRSRADIEGWFGDVRGLWLAAGHGAAIRPPGSREWEYSYTGYSPEWKRDVYPYLEHYADRTPGSFVEEKEFSLVWHYRMSDPEFGEWLANEPAHDLEQMLADTPLRAVRGQKSVEVRPMWADKGEVMNRLVKECPAPAFLLAAGDDKTDEDLFARLPATAWTIHVGENQSRARFRLPGPGQVCLLLEELVAAGRVEASRPTA